MKTINAYGLSKKISIENLKKMYLTWKGLKEARKIISEFKPDIVIGTGGYICGATKFLAKKTDKILVSFKDAIPRIKKAKNVVYTGTPVKIKRREYGNNEKNNILTELKLKEDMPIVLVSGGSQGAQKINEAIIEIIKNKMNII